MIFFLQKPSTLSSKRAKEKRPSFPNRYDTSIPQIPKTKIRKELRNKKNHIIGRSTIYSRTLKFAFVFAFITIDSLLMFPLTRGLRIHNALSLYTILAQCHPSFPLLQCTPFATNFLITSLIIPLLIQLIN